MGRSKPSCADPSRRTRARRVAPLQSHGEAWELSRCWCIIPENPGPEREGTSVFYKDAAGGIFHTYSTYARGLDLQNTAYNYLDLTPKGRDEGGRSQFWVRRRDEYGR